jgi:hypothetical protein
LCIISLYTSFNIFINSSNCFVRQGQLGCGFFKGSLIDIVVSVVMLLLFNNIIYLVGG